jgi:hypothetical protein
MNTLRSRLKNSTRLPAIVDSIDQAHTWTSMAAVARRPANGLNTKRVIKFIADDVIPRAPEVSKEMLEDIMRRKLHEGEFDFADTTVKLANGEIALPKGKRKAQKFCHALLMRVYHERAALPLTAPGHLQISNYGQQEGRHPRKLPPGPDRFDNLMRDIQICTVVVLVWHELREFGVTRTRNDDARDANGPPSACALVAAAYTLRGTPLSELHVQKEIWGGLAGLIVGLAYGLD